MGEKHNSQGFEDGFWWSNDGLRLHYRDYPGRGDRPPILCFPGLTRNARDFEGLAERLAGEWRIIAVELRGRGESAYAKDSMSYVPLTYLQDVEALIAHLELDRFIAFGTSLGGILTMLLAAAEGDHIVGALLNIFQSGLHAIAVVLIGAAAAWGIYYKNDYALIAWEVLSLADLVVATFMHSEDKVAIFFIAWLAIQIYFVYVIDEWRRNFDEPEEKK